MNIKVHVVARESRPNVLLGSRFLFTFYAEFGEKIGGGCLPGVGAAGAAWGISIIRLGRSHGAEIYGVLLFLALYYRHEDADDFR
mmetsp:Transcript_14708/g.31955  ORF Transcript_14708/g.31955 Transcript_14708/m.31955 type:complete len:85 (-) Transcript_14708:48-302(-)